MTEIKEAFDNTERIGVIGSPSSTGELIIDILGTAVSKRLVGNLSVFQYIQDGKDHYALGQITEIIMQNADLVIVPGIGFDHTGNRLGRGKGYYDSFLKGISPHTHSIGLGFDFQVLPTVPVAENDIPVDKVLFA